MGFGWFKCCLSLFHVLCVNYVSLYVFSGHWLRSFSEGPKEDQRSRSCLVSCAGAKTFKCMAAWAAQLVNLTGVISCHKEHLPNI